MTAAIVLVLILTSHTYLLQACLIIATFKPSPPILKVHTDAVNLIIAGTIKSVAEMSLYAPTVVEWLKVNLPLAHENKVSC